MDHVDGADTVAAGQHPVKCGWRAAALNVSEHHGTRLVSGLSLNFYSHQISYTAQAYMAKFVQTRFKLMGRVAGKLCAFGNYDDAEI